MKVRIRYNSSRYGLRIVVVGVESKVCFVVVAKGVHAAGAALLHAVVYTFALVFLLTHSIACAWYYVGQRIES
eukprot:3037623-Amphidinium_carterae.1